MKQVRLRHALNVIGMILKPCFPIPAARKYLKSLWVIAFVPLLNEMLNSPENAAAVEPPPEARVALVHVLVRVSNYEKRHKDVSKDFRGGIS